ncbi:expressed unknown protein [Seminavis robusta]|uniref:Uncharacterized protein n=1 Tax=Seminavis robusta TaxID=568900 RepID=A0A9N8EPX1_9STRA|nr:expressed unknown protein [Seminavis robusta]|eukprot:Sro1629_g287070.1 n/a (778) ;mRNA; r:2633-4966
MTRAKNRRQKRCNPEMMRWVSVSLAVVVGTPDFASASGAIGRHKIAIEPSTPASAAIRTHRSPPSEALFQLYRDQRQTRIEKLQGHIRIQEEQKKRYALDDNIPLTDRQMQAESGCPLCYDGSSVSNPSQGTSIAMGWTCGQLGNFVGLNLGPGELECLEFQTVGGVDCGCPSSPLDNDFCAMCTSADGTAQLIPDSYLDLPIPVTPTQPTEGLTCQDLVFVRQQGGVAPCSSLASYMRYCGCPQKVPDVATPNSPSTPGVADTPTDAPTSSTVAPTLAPISFQEMPPAISNMFTTSMPGDGSTTMIPTGAGPDPGDGGGTTMAPSAGSGPVDKLEDEATDAPNAGEPFSCFLCPDQNPPLFQNRVLPYLTPAPSPQSNTIPVGQTDPTETTTCGMLAAEAETLTDATECFDAIFPTVPLDVPSFCGCSSSQTWDLCSLCGNQPISNPDLNVPGSGGLTCLDLQEYMRFVTDENSCNTIAETARAACCTPLPNCPVCVNPVFTYAQDKLYPPFGLKCSELSLAERLGHNVTCPEIQERFGWYCECPNAIRPSCSLCGDGVDVPQPEQPVQALGEGVTCQEVDDYASLRPAETCESDIAAWSVDARAFCGCPGFSPRGDCRIACSSGLVVDTNALVKDEAGISINDYLTCGELFAFAPFVTSSDMCLAMQRSSQNGCCVAPGEETAGDAATSNTNAGRNFPPGSPGFLSYPFLNSDGTSSSSAQDPVHERTSITSPYGSPNYHHAAAASSASQQVMRWATSSLLVDVALLVVAGVWLA